MIKNLPTVQETWVRFLGWEDPLEKGMPLTPVSLLGESHGQRSLAGYSPWGCKELDMTDQLSDQLSHSHVSVVKLNTQTSRHGYISKRQWWEGCSLCFSNRFKILKLKIISEVGTSLAAQRLRPYTANAMGTDLIRGWGTEIPHAMWCGQKILK